jgi:hypothetical protein
MNFIDQDYELLCVGDPTLLELNSDDGTGTAKAYDGVPVTINEQFIRLREVAVINTGPLESLCGYKVQTILGIPFLRDGVIEYVDDEQGFRLGRNKSHKFDHDYPVKIDANGKPTTSDLTLLEENGGSLEIDGVFDIDTGKNSPVGLESKLFDLCIDRKVLKLDRELQDIGPSTTRKQVRTGVIRSARLWNIRFQDVPVSESSCNSIGAPLLRKWDFRLDLGRGTISLKENRKTSTPFARNRSGLRLRVQDGEQMELNLQLE